MFVISGIAKFSNESSAFFLLRFIHTNVLVALSSETISEDLFSIKLPRPLKYDRLLYNLSENEFCQISGDELLSFKSGASRSRLLEHLKLYQGSLWIEEYLRA